LYVARVSFSPDVLHPLDGEDHEFPSMRFQL
jgi:hypothetical protein